MTKIDPELEEMLYRADSQLQAAGMKPLDGEELKKLYHQNANERMGLAPMPQARNATGGMIQSQAPIAGFQGNSTFTNQVGNGMDVDGQMEMATGLGGPSQPMQQLDPRGQLMPQGGIKPQFDGQPSMLAQAQGGIMPQARGFNTTIQIGEDGQVSAINLKRAIAKKMRGQG